MYFHNKRYCNHNYDRHIHMLIIAVFNKKSSKYWYGLYLPTLRDAFSILFLGDSSVVPFIHHGRSPCPPPPVACRDPPWTVPSKP